jgi:hypothetical protein
MIDNLKAELKESKHETFAANAALEVMKRMAIDARSSKLELSHTVDLLRNVLDETPVEDDSEALRELRLMYCSEADKEALTRAGVLKE